MDHYSVNRPRRDGWLSWPWWLTDSGRFIHKVVTRPAISLAQDRESSPGRTGVLTTMLRHQQWPFRGQESPSPKRSVPSKTYSYPGIYTKIKKIIDCDLWCFTRLNDEFVVRIIDISAHILRPNSRQMRVPQISRVGVLGMRGGLRR